MADDRDPKAGLEAALEETADALRASEARARWLAGFPEENPNPVVRVSSDGVVLYLNPAASVHPAWRSELGGPLPDPGLRSLAGEALATGRPIERDLTLSGTPFAVSVVPVSAEGYANLYGRDASKRRRAQDALADSERRYAALFESMAEGCVIADLVIDEPGEGADVRYAAINPAAEVLLGVRAADAVGRSVFEVFPVHDRKATLDKYVRVARTGEPEQVELSVPAPGRWLRATYSRMGPGRVAVLFEDVTDRKAAEDELRRSRLDLDRAQEVGQMGWWRLDTRANVLTWSDETHRIFGLPKGTPLDYETFLATIHPDDRAYVHERWSAALRGEPYDIEHRIVANGDVKWVREKAYLEFDESGTLLGGFGVTQDVTRLKEAERCLREANESLEARVAERTAEVGRQAQQLRALATELTHTEQRERQRLARVLHDHLQQLLVGAQMQLSLLGRAGPETAEATAQSVRAIVNEALAASRSLTVELCPPVLHQSGLVAALSWLAVRAEEKHQFRLRVRATNDAEPASPEVRAFLFDAVGELVLNAVKHSGVREAELSMLRVGDACRIVLEDRGRGFDTASMTPGVTGGFGLFSIQQRLLHLGGLLEIESAPGRGTRGTLTIPVGEAPRAARQETEGLAVGGGARASMREPGRRIRVLLADDHGIVRQGLASLLRFEQDIDLVGEAENGRRAVEMAREHAPDVVVMDVNMPVMDGIEATLAIRREMPHVQVIGLSMHLDPDAAGAMRDAGAAAYLTKGGPSDDLLAAIRACRPGGCG